MEMTPNCSRRKKIHIAIVLLIAFIDWMGIGLVYPMFSSLLFHQGSSPFMPESSDAIRGFCLGTLLGVMPLAQFFSSPILGVISDQKGRKPILAFTLLIGVIGYLLSSIGIRETSFALLLVGRLIVGITAGNAAVANAVIADLSDSKEKVKNFGLLNMAAGIGFTVGPFIGGKLSVVGFLGIGSLDTPFLFAGALTFLNLLVLIGLFSETSLHKQKLQISFFTEFKKLNTAFNLKKARNLLICTFIFCFGWSFYWEFIPVTWIEKYKLDTFQVGNYYAYAAGFYALSCGLLIRPVANRLKDSLILFFSLIATGIYILSSYFLDGPAGLWLYLPFQQCFIAFLFPTAAAIISNYANENVQGETMGIFQSIQSLAFGLSPLISGALVGLNHKMPILVGGISMLLASLILIIGKPPKFFSIRADS